MEESNKLIAEFMGAEKTHIQSGKIGDIYCPVPSKNGSEYADKLQYHLSWDWLMPVVQKIEQDCEGVPQEMINISLYSDIKEVYKAVIEFIKDYNNGKN